MLENRFHKIRLQKGYVGIILSFKIFKVLVTYIPSRQLQKKKKKKKKRKKII